MCPPNPREGHFANSLGGIDGFEGGGEGVFAEPFLEEFVEFEVGEEVFVVHFIDFFGIGVLKELRKGKLKAPEDGVRAE